MARGAYAKAHRAECLSMSDLVTENARAVLRLHGAGGPGGIEDGDGERFHPQLGRLPERLRR
jgi:guanyl-specific ribonuclease Sa